MMLEALFAHGSQGRAFLALTVVGMALAAFVQCTAFMRKRRGLGVLLDVFTGLGLLAMLLAVIWRFESGVQVYAVLGLIIGAVLYMAGLAQPVGAAQRLVHKLFQKHAKSPGTQAGISRGDEE